MTSRENAAYITPDPEESRENQSKEEKNLDSTWIEAIQRSTQEFSKKLGKRLRDVFKDIEIERREFLVLLLIGLSVGSIAILTVRVFIDYYGFELNQQTNLVISGTPLFGTGILGIGMILGIIATTIMVDLVKKRFPAIIILMIISGITLGVYRYLVAFPSPILPDLVIMMNGFGLSSLIVMLITLTVEYTKILERGRVFAMIISISAFFSIINFFLVAGGAGILSVFFPIATSFFLYFHRDKEKISPSRLRKKMAKQDGWSSENPTSVKKTINMELLKYSAVVIIFAFLCGILVPSSEVTESVSRSWLELGAIMIFLISIVFAFVTAFLTGYFFDFFGRRTTISGLCLWMAFLNFSRLFQIAENQNVIFMVAFITALMISVPLIVGEFTKEENIGKTIALEILLLLVGFVTGAFVQNFTSHEFALGLSSLLVVCILFILTQAKETISPKEAAWPESLLHLYIIHESGVLLFDHSFAAEDPGEDRVESDLVSGGIVGTLLMLQEISRGKQNLRIIDHGDKHFMFRYSEDGQVIFVLLITRELVVLRNKLFEFSREFENRFRRIWQNFRGVRMMDMAETGFLIEKYFTRKFFPLIQFKKKPLLPDEGVVQDA